MAILHKFLDHNFGNGFQTHNSILDITPYEPEVIFIGTFNHGWSWNQSDFFYGRGMYMWPALCNLFLYNQNQLISQRTNSNNNPTLNQIFEICSRSKIVFADIVKGVKPEICSVELEDENCVLVNNEYRWETRTINGIRVGEYSDNHLEYLAERNWLDDNVSEIINFINFTPSIKHVYFTFKSGNWLVSKLIELKNGIREDIQTGSIFTPTANGFRRNLEVPFNERLWSLTHCWVWNGLPHVISINKNDYFHLNHEWLRRNGVNPDNF